MSDLREGREWGILPLSNCIRIREATPGAAQPSRGTLKMSTWREEDFFFVVIRWVSGKERYHRVVTKTVSNIYRTLWYVRAFSALCGVGSSMIPTLL